MRFVAISLGALLLTQAITVQASEPREEKSVRRFVQGFYDWYTPKAFADDHRLTWPLAFKSKSAMFNPKLVKALREDQEAQNKVQGELVGIDYDPFMNSQDPDPRYLVDRVRKKGEFYFVYMRRVPAETRKPTEVAVIAKVEKNGGHWRFANFLDSKNGGDLLSVLRSLKEDRKKPVR